VCQYKSLPKLLEFVQSHSEISNDDKHTIEQMVKRDDSALLSAVSRSQSVADLLPNIQQLLREQKPQVPPSPALPSAASPSPSLSPSPSSDLSLSVATTNLTDNDTVMTPSDSSSSSSSSASTTPSPSSASSSSPSPSSSSDAVQAEEQHANSFEYQLDKALATLAEAKAPLLKSANTQLTTLLNNLRKKPSDARHRKIRMDNLLIKKHIVDVPGALQLLHSCGFTEVEAEGKKYLNIELDQIHQEHLDRALERLGTLQSSASSSAASSSSAPSSTATTATPTPTTPTKAQLKSRGVKRDREAEEGKATDEGAEKEKKAKNDTDESNQSVGDGGAMLCFFGLGFCLFSFLFVFMLPLHHERA